MKTIRKILKIGNSKLISLPKEITQNLAIGDVVLFDINVKEILTNTERTYRCKKCGYDFSAGTEDVYCPACSNEDNETFEIIEEI